MYRVALTGNIASGKSAVARVWARLGAAVVDADRLAREAVEPGTPGHDAVVRRFGPGVLEPGGRIDRAALRRLAFGDDSARRDLERILHPEIGRLRAAEDERLERAGTALVAHVIPLLFEVGLETEYDAIVLVDAPEAVRLRRLVDRRGLAEVEAKAMVEAQMPASAKRARATLLIENTGTLKELERAAGKAWRELERRAASTHRS
jgi:dephospho-CoA kinase